MGKYKAGYSKAFKEKFNYAIDIPLLFARKLIPFTRVDGINIHHMAIYTATPQRIHQGHLSEGGKARHTTFTYEKTEVFVSCGVIRLEDTRGKSSHIIGVGFEGYYHPRASGQYDRAMPHAQFQLGVRVIRSLGVLSVSQVCQRG